MMPSSVASFSLKCSQCPPLVIFRARLSPESIHNTNLCITHLGLDHLGASQRLHEPNDVDGLEPERRRKVARVDRSSVIRLLREGQEQRALELLEELVGKLVVLLALGGLGHRAKERKERERNLVVEIAGLISIVSEKGGANFLSAKLGSHFFTPSLVSLSSLSLALVPSFQFSPHR